MGLEALREPASGECRTSRELLNLNKISIPPYSLHCTQVSMAERM